MDLEQTLRILDLRLIRYERVEGGSEERREGGREVKRERRKREGEGDRGNTSEERENNNILYRCLH